MAGPPGALSHQYLRVSLVAVPPTSYIPFLGSRSGGCQGCWVCHVPTAWSPHGAWPASPGAATDGLGAFRPPVHPWGCKVGGVREPQGLCSPTQDERVAPGHMPLSQAEQEGPCPRRLFLQSCLSTPRFKLCCLSSHSVSPEIMPR